VDISKVDKNFIVNSCYVDGDLKYYAVPNDKTSLYGVYYDYNENRFLRMPLDIAKTVNDVVYELTPHTAGGRLRFSTDSKTLKIVAKWDVKLNMPHMPSLGSSGFTLYEDFEDGSSRFLKSFIPQVTDVNGFEGTVILMGDKVRNYTLFFPLYNEVTSLTMAIDENATLDKGLKYKDYLPILYYGSSITQGGCVCRPDNCFANLICKETGIDHINLGFSGSARGEQTMCDYLASIPCSVFVCDYDHNAPNAEHLRKTHYNVYETFRKAQPNTPIIFVTRPDYYGFTAYGDGGKVHDLVPENYERLQVIKNTYKKALKNGDKNVYFVNGSTFFKGKNDICTCEGCHPNDLGHYLMAQKIKKVIVKVLGL
jgi:hypothetical protein